MRFGLAIVALLWVIVALYVAPAFSQLAHQLGGHVVAGPDDQKSTFHAEGTAR